MGNAASHSRAQFIKRQMQRIWRHYPLATSLTLTAWEFRANKWVLPINAVSPNELVGGRLWLPLGIENLGDGKSRSSTPASECHSLEHSSREPESP